MKQIIMKMIGLYLNTLALIAPKRAGQKGFELFCYPARIPINSKQRVFLESAKSQGFDHEGSWIQTYSWGNGPKNILLLHGWQSHTYRWKRYVELLDKSEYTIYALDAPGHGLSGGKFLSVPLYSEVISHFVERFNGNIHAVISHSVGSFSALYTFFKNPALSSVKLVTLASPGEASEFFQFYKKSLGLSARSEKLITGRFKQLFQHTPDYFSAPFFASHIRASGLIIHDEDDTETSVDHAKRISTVWTTSKIWITKGFGHNLRSDDVVNAVLSFIAQSGDETEYPFAKRQSLNHLKTQSI
jgi:pimeloyl-ACP methyl ester carboxylesterase